MFKLYKYQMKDNARMLKGMGQKVRFNTLFFGEKIYIFGQGGGKGVGV